MTAMYAIVSLLSFDSADKITSYMVKHGYAVSSISQDGKPCHTDKDNLVVVCAISVAKDAFAKGKTAQATVADDIKECCRLNGLTYLSYAVFAPSSCITWFVGNAKKTTPNVLPP